MKSKSHILFWLFFILFNNLVIAQSFIVVNDDEKLINISNKVSIFKDTENKLSIQDIIKDELRSKFVKNENTYISMNGKDESIWIKFSLQNNSQDKVYMMIDNVGIFFVEIYNFKGELNSYQVKKVNSATPIKSKEIPLSSLISPLLTAQDSSVHHFYIKVSYTGRFYINLMLSTTPQIITYNHHKNIFYNLFFGAIIIMSLHNLSIYFSTKDSNYLYYVFYVISRGFYTFIIRKYFLEIFDTIPTFLLYFIDSAVFHLSLFCATFFAISFLETKKNVPLAHKSMIGILILLIVSFISSLFDSYLFWVMRDILGISFPIYLFIISVYIYINKDKTIYFYFIANIFFSIGVILGILQINQIVLEEYLLLNPYIIGTTLEVIFFALALSNKIKVLSRSREKAQKRNIDLIERQKETLEKEVKKRTKELEETNQEIEMQNEELHQQREELVSVNENLEEKNQKIKTQNVELHQQREELVSVNESLEEKNQEIETQNEELISINDNLEEKNKEIELLNNNLEDIVAQRTTELYKTLDNLTKQNQDLAQFSFIISHNIRSPIARILGLVNIFNENDYNDIFNKDIINHLRKTTTDLDTVIKDLTQIISIRNDLNKSKEQVDILEVIDLERFLLQDEIKMSKAIIKTDLVNIKDFFSIKSYFQSIVHNLLSNSIKYKSKKRNPIIHIKTEIVNNFICFSVQDNGLGIDLDNTDTYKVFGLYQRMHDHVEGKGLGLFLVKTQIESLGGKVELDSQLDVGSTFKVYFPM